ncbi:hypothetical protein DL89DRAFT_265589 [Linderina pennispora]|uniref:Protein BCP1 n=1 Tax=Linderina pennispora TaxID=61395 RepID=A0A1Y1WEC3_9FUNG|nr:uncharacterized protein DL89DRAFT_265589 [Linderina pennispora]ORX71879.1 hypothetical protein DL89DRAFT_265589 [Linderina pennispora]
MGRKRQHSDDEASTRDIENSDSGASSGPESDFEKDLVDVDFEFFDPKPIDFHAMKAPTDFGDDDPYAFMTVLNMDVHKDKQVIKQIREYLLKKAEKAGKGGDLLDVLDGSGDVGLLLNERVVNMPPQVVAPMLAMLMEELDRTTFDYYLLLAPTYKDTAAVEDEDGSSSRRPKDKESLIDAYLHAEDEFIEEFAQVKFDYKFSRSKRVSESRNSFAETGVAPARRCLIIHKSKIRALIDRLQSALSPSS